MFLDLEFIKTCLNGLRSRIEKVEKQTKNWVTSFVRANRPNWAQNDPNALDYVKGRTHWEKEVVVDMSGKLYKITGFTGNTLAVTYDVIPFELGQVWSVQGGNGSAYTNVEVQRNADGVLYLGEPTMSNVPFYITKDTATINSLWQSAALVSSLTLTCTSGSATIRTVHPLNPKFLPSPTANTVGAIKADSAKTTDIQPVRLGTDGKLYSSGIPIFTTSGTESAYTANVLEINELVNGMLVVMIPHVASGSTSPTLNINGFGAHQIRRFKSSGSSNNYSGSYTNWLYPGVPVLLMYNSGLWFACNFTKPDANDLLGTVSALHGGTGASSLKKGSYLVGNGTGKVLQKTPSEVLADIGAIPVPATASVGQVIAVKAVDADGRPTEWEAVDVAGGDLSWIEVADITTEEQTKKLIISTDKDGRPISQYNALEMIFSILFPADATQTSDNGSAWIYPYPKMGENAYRYIATISMWKTIERTLTHEWAGLPRVPWSSAIAAQTTFGTNGDVDFMSGLCVYINQSGDHIPAGTRVRIAVLSKGVTA